MYKFFVKRLHFQTEELEMYSINLLEVFTDYNS